MFFTDQRRTVQRKKTRRLLPKSTSLIPPCVVKRMLLPLTSRWMVLLTCRCWRPCEEEEKKRLTAFFWQAPAFEIIPFKPLFTEAVYSAGGLFDWGLPTVRHCLQTEKKQTYHEGLVQDVGNNGFIHSVASLQHAFSQICHRAAVAELQQQKTQRKEKKLDMSQHFTIWDVQNLTCRSFLITRWGKKKRSDSVGL